MCVVGAVESAWSPFQGKLVTEICPCVRHIHGDGQLAIDSSVRDDRLVEQNVSQSELSNVDAPGLKRFVDGVEQGHTGQNVDVADAMRVD
jgi:hypothetical protein